MIRPSLALLLALAAFVTGFTARLLAEYAQSVSNAALVETQLTAPTPTLAPRQEPKTAYYIGVYDACKLFAVQAAGMSEQESQLECLGFVQRVKNASWYETSNK